MRANTLIIMGVSVLIFSSCQEKEKPLENNLLGEWTIDGSSTEIFLNGEVNSLTEIGTKLFDLNEASAQAYMEDYLQNQILGPLMLTDASVFFAEDILTVKKGQSQRKSSWQLLNEKTILKLSSLENNSEFLFNISFIPNQQIDLSWEWEIENINNPTNVNNLEIKLKLTK